MKVYYEIREARSNKTVSVYSYRDEAMVELKDLRKRKFKVKLVKVTAN